MKILENQCMGCENCIPHCPRHLLQLSKERNIRGVRHLMNIDQDQCIDCGICELMCTAGAIITSHPGGHELIDPDHIPPHSGCYLGSLSKALADVITKLKIAEDTVIFKVKASDVNLRVEIHDYTEGDHFIDGLQYKKDHPEKIVIIITSSSKVLSTATNEARLLSLENESVTIINTLNFFESDDDFTTVTKGGSRIIETLAKDTKASYVARGSVRTPQQIRKLENELETAIRNQIAGKPFSVVEMVFPCFYRLAHRPQILMESEKIQRINQWFDENLSGEYSIMERKLEV